MGISNPNNPTAAEAPLQAEYNKKVIQLAFLVACLYTVSGWLGLGVILTRFMSHPTISGFISGASVIIILSQVGGRCMRGSAGRGCHRHCCPPPPPQPGRAPAP